MFRHIRSSGASPLFRNGTFRYVRLSSTQSQPSRLARLESRLPRFLQRYTQPLRTAPVSHITAFLILHELTAIVPLFGLAAAFHYFDWLPPYISEGAWVKEGMERMGRYARKKGWLDDQEAAVTASPRGRWWGRGEGGVRIVVELATAWAVTKALLPLRLILSISATPWFARVTMLPALRFVKRLFARAPSKVKPSSGKTASSPAVGTNAVGGRAPPPPSQKSS